MLHYIDKAFADQFGYIFVPPAHLCTLGTFGPFLRDESEAVLNSLLHGNADAAGRDDLKFTLVESENIPAARKTTWYKRGTVGEYQGGTFGDWETCVWLLTYSERDRAMANVFLSAPGAYDRGGHWTSNPSDRT
jgi:hypothetical protein